MTAIWRIKTGAYNFAEFVCADGIKTYEDVIVRE